tara:strand:- start:942 stop:1235 length:294 start_codon:yes stop_codon:yes gene_type:complete
MSVSITFPWVIGTQQPQRQKLRRSLNRIRLSLELRSAILRPTGLVLPISDGPVLTIADNRQLTVGNAEVDKVTLHRTGATLTEMEVVLFCPPLVSVS